MRIIAWTENVGRDSQLNDMTAIFINVLNNRPTLLNGVAHPKNYSCLLSGVAKGLGEDRGRSYPAPPPLLRSIVW